MIGILVQLAISWLLIWFFEKGNLSFLGFSPTKKRITDFFIFFLITAACCASGYLLRILLGNEQWKINPAINFSLIAKGVWWNIKSVLFEELIFRGVLFYMLIKKLGAVKAIIISSAAFGVYHWFSFEILGNPLEMIFTFFITGIMGAVYAFGYAKTFSLFIPCAIHLGWNLTRSVIFSDTGIGKQLLVPVAVEPVQVSYLIFFIILIFPLLSAVLINFFLIKKKKQVFIN
jgi:membrane protease YdiL (CAAX protease family)